MAQLARVAVCNVGTRSSTGPQKRTATFVVAARGGWRVGRRSGTKLIRAGRHVRARRLSSPSGGDPDACRARRSRCRARRGWRWRRVAASRPRRSPAAHHGADCTPCGGCRGFRGSRLSTVASAMWTIRDRRTPCRAFGWADFTRCRWVRRFVRDGGPGRVARGSGPRPGSAPRCGRLLLG